MTFQNILQKPSRRQFMKGLGGVAVLSGVGESMGAVRGRRAPKLAAQLYSIHKIFWQKPEWCLEGLKKAGYDGVEFAGYGGHSAKEIRKYLADAGLVGMGTHVNGFTELTGDGLAKTLDFCAEAGFASVTTPHALCKDEAGYRRFGRDMSLAAEKATPSPTIERNGGGLMEVEKV